jgi:hypothetical protein
LSSILTTDALDAVPSTLVLLALWGGNSWRNVWQPQTKPAGFAALIRDF